MNFPKNLKTSFLDTLKKLDFFSKINNLRDFARDEAFKRYAKAETKFRRLNASSAIVPFLF